MGENTDTGSLLRELQQLPTRDLFERAHSLSVERLQQLYTEHVLPTYVIGGDGEAYTKWFVAIFGFISEKKRTDLIGTWSEDVVASMKEDMELFWLHYRLQEAYDSHYGARQGMGRNLDNAGRKRWAYVMIREYERALQRDPTNLRFSTWYYDDLLKDFPADERTACRFPRRTKEQLQLVLDKIVATYDPTKQWEIEHIFDRAALCKEERDAFLEIVREQPNFSVGCAEVFGKPKKRGRMPLNPRTDLQLCVQFPWLIDMSKKLHHKLEWADSSKHLHAVFRKVVAMDDEWVAANKAEQIKTGRRAYRAATKQQQQEKQTAKRAKSTQ